MKTKIWFNARMSERERENLKKRGKKTSEKRRKKWMEKYVSLKCYFQARKRTKTSDEMNWKFGAENEKNVPSPTNEDGEWANEKTNKIK